MGEIGVTPMGNKFGSKVNAPGVAGAPPNGVEITPQMTEAGLTALEWYRGSYPDELLVETIYRAMRALEPVRP